MKKIYENKRNIYENKKVIMSVDAGDFGMCINKDQRHGVVILQHILPKNVFKTVSDNLWKPLTYEHAAKAFSILGRPCSYSSLNVLIYFK